MVGFLTIQSKKRRRETMEEEDEKKPFLCDELLEQILRKLPLKQRTRFKSVSKFWQDLITRLPRTSPSNSGLAFSFKKPCAKGALNYELTLLNINGRGERKTCSTIHSSIPHDFPWLIDSCNGLLLFGIEDGSFLSYHVFSPMKNQWRQLPPGHDFFRPASASLAFDGLRPNFKVICNFWEEADTKNGTITYQIFSSKNWEWRECRASIRKSGLLLSNQDFNMNEWSCPSLYRKGKVYWIWSIYLLVLDEEEESFELMKLPKNKEPEMSVYCGKRLWEFEGLLHYCDSTYMGFYIWYYADDNSVHDKKRNDCSQKWRPKHSVQFDFLVSRNKEVLQIEEEDKFKISPFIVKPCALNEDLDTLYLQFPGTIAAYSFETRKLDKVHSDSAIGNNINDNIYPFLFEAVDLFGKEC